MEKLKTSAFCNAMSAKPCKKRRIAVSVFVILLAVLLVLPAFYQFNAHAATKSQLQNKIAGLKSSLSSIKSDQTSLQDYIASIQADKKTKVTEIAQTKSEIDLITKELETVYQLIDEYELLIEEKYVEKGELESKRDAQEQHLSGVLRLSYEYGDDNFFEILFGAEDFSDFLARLDYLSYHIGAGGEVLEELDDTYTQLIETTEIYESSLTSIEEYRDSSEQLQATLEAKKAAAEIALAALNEEEAEQLKALEEYEAERRATENEIAQLSAELKRQEEAERKAREEAERRAREEAARNAANNKGSTTTSKPVSTYSGSFGWPLNGYSSPSTARISSGFGSRTNPITFRAEFHNGIDLPAPRGTGIYAPADGTVSSSGVKGGYGNCVVISHGGGVVTLYGHCDSLHCVTGQKVKKGDLIARVGTTGQSTGNHLHFTIYEGGTAVNPMSYY